MATQRPLSTARPAAAARQAPRVTYLVGRADRALSRRIRQVLEPFSLSLAQYTTLSVLHAGGALSNAQLAYRALISPQSMNEMVQGLEARRLITRRPDASHGRVVQLLLTARGQEVMISCDSAVRALEQTMLAGLSHADAAALERALRHCIRTMEQEE